MKPVSCQSSILSGINQTIVLFSSDVKYVKFLGFKAIIRLTVMAVWLGWKKRRRYLDFLID